MGTVSIIVTAATSTVTETSSTETAPLTSATTPVSSLNDLTKEIVSNILQGSGGGGGGVGGTTVGITTEAIVTTISTGSSYRTETTETTVFYTISSTSTTQAVSSTSRPASSSPSTSSPTSTPAEIASSEGLTSGAEAGIGVGAVLGVIIALSLAFFCFRKRKKQSEEREIQDLEIADPLAAQRGHELITSAHTHEMDAQRPINVQEDLKAYRTEGFQELEAQNSPPIHSTIRPEDPAEMDAPYNIQSTNVGLDWKHLQPSELDASASAAQRAEFHSVPTYSGSVSTHPQSLPVSFVNTSQIEGPRPVEQGSPSTPAASSSSPSNAEDKLEVLRKRMERVREDKERLEKIQALKDLEAELQAEILAVRQFDTGKSHVK